MFGIGMPELIVIFVIALLVFGPKELPKIGKTIGKAMAEFRRASDELRDGIQREIDLAERETQEKVQGTTDSSSSEGSPESTHPVSADEATSAPVHGPSTSVPTSAAAEVAEPTLTAAAPGTPPPKIEAGPPASPQPAETRNA